MYLDNGVLFSNLKKNDIMKSIGNLMELLKKSHWVGYPRLRETNIVIGSLIVDISCGVNDNQDIIHKTTEGIK